jgi:hypothetical protein
MWLEAGATYSLTASGTWYDAGHPSGPEGYSNASFVQNLAAWARRAPRQDWFALPGAAEPEQEPFFIGLQAKYTARQIGELVCFCNDVPGFYWNNAGEILLTVKRLC